MDCPFTREELIAAHEEWGCNCGPAALAFALQKPLADVRSLITGFDQKRYTSPTMMQQAIAAAGQTIDVQPPSQTQRLLNLFDPTPAVVRIQWTGPWTKSGALAKWAYRHTHWIATWMHDDLWMVFDVNCGMSIYSRWAEQTVPAIVGTIPRADGGWFPTHIWRLKREIENDQERAAS